MRPEDLALESTKAGDSLCDLFFKDQMPSAPHKVKFVDEQGVERLFQKRKDDGTVDLTSMGRVILNKVDVCSFEGREIGLRGEATPEWDGGTELKTVIPRSKEFMIAKLLALFTNEQLVNAFAMQEQRLTSKESLRGSSKEIPTKPVDYDYGGKHPQLPKLQVVTFADPRRDADGGNAGVVAFCHPNAGEDDPCDILCRAPFLGNRWELGQGYLKLSAPVAPDKKHKFSNAETAFHALQFWTHADDFEELAGYDLVRQRKSMKGNEDGAFAGYGSQWKGMLAVLRAKFWDGSVCGDALQNTGDAFLLCHNGVSGRDTVWSDNNRGDGTNWLGIQLMIIRDENNANLRRERKSSTESKDGERETWPQYISSFFDIAEGKPLGGEGKDTWQRLVQQATMAAKEVLGEPEDAVADAEDSDEDSDDEGSAAPDAGTASAATAPAATAPAASRPDKVMFLDADDDPNLFQRNAEGGVDFIAAGARALQNIKITGTEGRTISFVGTAFPEWEGSEELDSEVPEGQEAVVDKVLSMFK